MRDAGDGPGRERGHRAEVPDAGLIEEVRARIREASRILVVTGAGVSAESGVPTFRGEEGLWRSHRPEELATPGAFRRDPRLVWEWYAWRREKVAACAPNPAHQALARLQLRRGSSVTLATQNVDGLHEAALGAAVESAGAEGQGSASSGSPSSAPSDILELHGSLFRVRCTRCDHRVAHREPVSVESRETLPACPGCRALLRPDVVWFGESLDPAVLERAFGAARAADLCLVVGTSAVVQPAASLPRVTREAGGDVVEVNPEPTPLSALARWTLRGAAGEILPRVIDPVPSR